MKNESKTEEKCVHAAGGVRRTKACFSAGKSCPEASLRWETPARYSAGGSSVLYILSHRRGRRGVSQAREVTLAAWGPLAPSTISKVTSCPSARVLKPSFWMAE